MTKDTIIFISNWFSGDLDQNYYLEVIRKNLHGSYTPLFFNEDSHIFQIEMQKVDLDKVIGVVFVGELIHDENDNFNKFNYFVEWANTNNIPYGFMCCGVRYMQRRDPSFFEKGGEAVKWKPALEKAKFVFVRSKKESYDFRKNLPGTVPVKHVKDLAYEIARMYPNDKDLFSGPDYDVIVYTPRLAEGNYATVIRKQLTCNKVRILMVDENMDGTEADFKKFIQRLKTPVEVYHCNFVGVATDMIGSANKVFTGKYLGLILAKSYKVPCVYPLERMPQKFMDEKARTGIPAKENFDFIKYFLR